MSTRLKTKNNRRREEYLWMYEAPRPHPQRHIVRSRPSRTRVSGSRRPPPLLQVYTIPYWARSLSSRSPNASQGQTTAESAGQESVSPDTTWGHTIIPDSDVGPSLTSETLHPRDVVSEPVGGEEITGSETFSERRLNQKQWQFDVVWGGFWRWRRGNESHPFCPALGALLLNCLVSFCLNLGGATLAPSPAAAAFIVETLDQRKKNDI